MRSTVTAMLVLAGAISADARACAPGRLVRMEIVDVPVGAEAAADAPVSRVIHRFSNRRMRMEQSADSPDGSRMMLVIDAPRLWHVDLARGVGERAIDPEGAQSVVNAPIFPVDGLPEELQDVEFGCEREFIARLEVTHEPAGDGAAAGTLHALASGAWSLTVRTRASEGLPETATLARNGREVAAIRYLAYEFLDEVPADLFKPPTGIAFKNAE